MRRREETSRETAWGGARSGPARSEGEGEGEEEEEGEGLDIYKRVIK